MELSFSFKFETKYASFWKFWPFELQCTPCLLRFLHFIHLEDKFSIFHRPRFFYNNSDLLETALHYELKENAFSPDYCITRHSLPPCALIRICGTVEILGFIGHSRLALFFPSYLHQFRSTFIDAYLSSSKGCTLIHCIKSILLGITLHLVSRSKLWSENYGQGRVKLREYLVKKYIHLKSNGNSNEFWWKLILSGSPT